MSSLTQHTNKKFKYSPLALALLIAVTPMSSYADNYFNPQFLSSDPEAVADLSHFENGNSQAPGTYRVDVYLNEKFIASKDVKFVDKKGLTAPASKSNETSQPANTAGNISAPAAVVKNDDTGLQPCLTIKSLDLLGVKLSSFPELAKLPADACVDINAAIPSAGSRFDFEQQRLDISIPQAAMNNNARGYIPPEQWDNGIPAILLNYNFTGSNSKDSSNNTHNSNNSYFLSLNSGINVGPWRLRDFSTGSYTSGGSHGESAHDWQHVSTYLQRAIIPVKGQLTVGDSYTPGDVFDSLSFRGVQLASDDNMLPDSLRGFAPTVRGIAKSNAQVTVKQNGYVIYQTYVSPGEFAIDDLYPTSSSGDLQVTVKEADGSSTSFTVPYSAVPILQREGLMKYALTAAKYRSSNGEQDDMNFAQGTLIYGLPRGFTVYGGSQFATNYHSLALGAGVNMGDFGALSADVTGAKSTLADDSEHTGASYRLLYAKSLNSIGTNFQLMGYRYSTSGFYTLDETAYTRMQGYTVKTQDGDEEYTPDLSSYYNLYYSKRGKVQLNISQQLGDYGSLFATGSQQSYWHTDKTDSLLQLGFNSVWNDINYSLSYNYNKSAGQPNSDQMFALTFSVPLSKWLSPNRNMTDAGNNAYATYSANTDTHGNTTQNAGVNGTLLEDHNLNYSVQQGYGNHGVGASGNANLNYQGGYGNANAGYNYSSNGDYQQVNYGVSGGVVGHAEGITFSQPLGDTNVLIASPGADNVSVENSTGIKTDWRGYAVVPYATTYRQNRVALDTNSLDNNIEVEDGVATVVPTQGAMVKATFKAQVGVRVLLTLMRNQKPVPFGAVVSLIEGSSTGMVGDDGQVYLAGMPLQGKLKVQWGEGTGDQCMVNYILPDNSVNQAITRIKQVCQ
ncbi:fimbrial biogenesis usher protein [Lelliottia wanjuensis]|uniref:fimbrial biogenesis usher protein n=1 Tax=Lelliottia wanjuensis TaxID=3050585 RepID=UPI00254DB8D1|nr:fimbrial biogenesis usher protein [Lelliottia sp. V104_15]MDK9604841.1 fimbrial biogenesis usher protein [Lelliottia sp. V104_15]